MLKLGKKEIEKIAKLANLTLTPQEVEKYGNQLSQVVEFVAQLSEVDTSGVEPVAQTTGLENVFRTDELKNDQLLTPTEAISGTEEVHNDFFKVGAILKDKDEQ
jgi:aspartyl-tRNA(Asn)/glutamyl-tRNA(Gln) amidotransferase subunit C